MMRRRAAVVIAVLALLSALPAMGRGPSGGGEPVPPTLKFSVTAEPSPLPASGGATLKLTIGVPAGYHIFGAEGLSVKAELPSGVAAGAPAYPKGTMEEEVEVLRGAVVVTIPLALAANAPATVEGRLQVEWQGCQDTGDKVCFLPTSDAVPLLLPTVKAGPVSTTHSAGSPVPPPGSLPAATQSAGTGAASADPAAGFRELGRFVGFKDAGAFVRWLDEARNGRSGQQGYEARFARAAKENVPLALALAFLFGLLSSLTPCVYPVVPITVAYIGSRSEGRGKSHGFFLSLAFVAGLALVYSTLGAISARAGAAFGSLAQNRWVGLGLAVLFYALALSMLNLFELRTPSALANRLERSKQKGKGRGFAGAFFIGAVSGLVASPCIGPLILAILVVVASAGSVLLGFAYLFAFALGMGVLFVVIGAFSGILSALPKSGGWMDGVRLFFGALILAASFYFAGLYLPRKVFFAAGGLALWAVLLYLLFGAKRHFFSVPARVAGILLCAAAFAAILPLLPAAPASAGPGAVWRADLGAAASEAGALSKPVLLDFRADWCVACVELEKETWPAPEVRAALAGLVPVRLDMTENNASNRALQARFGVKGLPTVILLAPPPAAAPAP